MSTYTSSLGDYAKTLDTAHQRIIAENHLTPDQTVVYLQKVGEGRPVTDALCWARLGGKDCQQHCQEQGFVWGTPANAEFRAQVAAGASLEVALAAARKAGACGHVHLVPS